MVGRDEDETELSALDDAVEEEIGADMNEVLLKGKILRIYKSNGFMNITLLTDVYESKGVTHMDYPDATCFGALAEEAYKKVHKGDYVCIHGKMHSRRKNLSSAVQAKHFKSQEIRAYSIEKQESLMTKAFGIEGRTYEKPESIVVMSGVLVYMQSPSFGNVSIGISSSDGSRETRVTGNYYTRYATKVIGDFKIGDKVAIVGSIKSVKNEDGYYESLVINEIKKIKKEEGDDE